MHCQPERVSLREGSLRFAQIAQVLRFAQDDKEFTTGMDKLVFFVLIGFVQGETAEFVRHFEQVLVAVVPLGADFTEEH